MYVKRIDLAKLFIGLNPLSFFPVLNQCHVFIFSISIPDLCEEIDNCCKLNSHPENSRILKLGGEGGGKGEARNWSKEILSEKMAILDAGRATSRAITTVLSGGEKRKRKAGAFRDGDLRFTACDTRRTRISGRRCNFWETGTPVIGKFTKTHGP